MINPLMQEAYCPQILVVDDNPANLRLLTGILAHHGYQVRPASSGRLALRSVAAEAPDLILLDVRMPDIDGYEVCRRLKTHQVNRGIPVIFISALDEVADKIKGFDVGGVDYITKPFQAAEVLARVETHLALRRLQRELEAQNVHLQHQIAERGRIEEMLRDSEANYRNIFDNAPVGMYQTTPDGSFLNVNEALARIFGYESPADVMTSVKDIATDMWREPPNRRKMIDRAMAQDGVVNAEVEFIRKDGSTLTANLYVQAVRNADGSVRCLEGFVEDITDRKRAEQDREKLRSHLMRVQKMQAIGTLTGGIAHDFNNMLTIILGYAELLLNETAESDPKHADLAKIVQTSRNGADLIQRLLTFSRQADTQALRLSLNDQIGDVHKLLLKAIPKMVEIDLVLEDNLATIEADPAQMEQVVMNLAVNGSKAMPQGGKLTIETKNVVLDDEACRTHHGAKPGKYVLLRVSETGPGMDTTTMDRMFDPFFTTKGWDSRKGTGLGLSTVQGVVERHDGFIECLSNPGDGTTFSAYFPAMGEDVETKELAGGQISRAGSETILLVDDEESIRELAKRYLERAGYSVIEAGNGMEALELYRNDQETISVIVLDLIMPQMGGNQCLRELLKINPEAKVIVASGYSSGGSNNESRDLGVKGFVAKPFNMRKLLEIVRDVLDKS